MPKFRWAIAFIFFVVLSRGGFGSNVGAAEAFAADKARFIVDQWGTKDGLPQNSVIAMTQTRDGYLWLGTLNGLVRFDGVRFTDFDESSVSTLNSETVVHLFEDSRRNIWVGTANAGIFWIKTNGSVQALEQTVDGGGERLVSTCEDSSGSVWLYTAAGKLIRYRAGRFEAWQVGIPSLNYRAIIQSGPDRLLIGTPWDGAGALLLELNLAEMKESSELLLKPKSLVADLEYLLASQRGGYWLLANGLVQKWQDDKLEKNLGQYRWTNATVSVACEDREGNLVVGTLNVNDGIYWYDASGSAAHLSRSQNELSHDGILSLCVDHEGSLWVGTDGGGLNRVKRSSFDVLPESLNITIQSVSEDAEGGVWIAFGGNAAHLKNGELQRFASRIGPAEIDVSTVFVDSRQRVWAGSRNGGLLLWQNERFEPVAIGNTLAPGVLAIHEDRSGNLWVGTEGGLARWNETDWKVFTTRDGLSGNSVRAIASAANGDLWIGTAGAGLNLLRGNSFTVFRTSEGLPSNKISSLHADASGVLWIGTEGGGLARYEDGKFFTFSKRDGLPSNNLGFIVEDQREHLWLGSYAGLIRISKAALNEFARGATNQLPFRLYGEADGLPTSECSDRSQPAAISARNETLWFPMIKGLVSLNLERLRLNTNPPPVLIESVSIEGQRQNTNGLRTTTIESVTIPPRREGLEIQYTSLNLSAPDRTRFKYRLENYESQWTDAGNSRVARFGRLPAGEYTFQVIACNEDGVWNNEGATLAVTVLPPFWQTKWFLLTTSAICLGLIVLAVYYVSTQKLQRQLALLKQQEALEKERARIARDLHDQLGANLTQIALLGEMAESDKHLPDEIEEHSRQICRTARETTTALDEIVWAANPANDTLDSLITYACKYAQDYFALAGVRHRLDVPAELPDVTIPPEVRHNVFLAFKEAVNNVVKHAQASEARIRLRLNADKFSLEVEDNGRGLGDLDLNAPSVRNGLRNMRKRMEDVRGSFSLENRADGGTVVRLSAPLNSH